ncbi:MAG: SMP-30/gluconolactonase/LRE family protein [Verrucomicrobiota bacterium]
MKAELIWNGQPELTEGPVWHEGALWWVDITRGTLNRLEPGGGRLETRGIGETLGAAVPAADGRWVCAGRTAVHAFDWDSGALETRASLENQAEYIRFNDGKTDPAGRFWCGTLGMGGKREAGAFYRLDGGALAPIFERVSVSNGLAWNAAADRMFYIDSPTRRVDVLDYDHAAGTVANRRPLVEIPEERGAPDGMCIDHDDNLWVAHWGGHAVHCYHGTSGELLATVEVGSRHVSSCCFGGANGDELYITAACDLGGRLESPCEGGGVYVARPGVSGPPVTLAKL